MTKLSKHETLALIHRKGVVTIGELVRYGGYHYSAAQQALKRLHSQRLINLVRTEGKKKFFTLSDYGLERLNYFESHGCNNFHCTCKVYVPEGEEAAVTD